MKLPFQWKQGEHLALIGDTGSGKSTMAAHLLQARTHRLILRSKPDDVEYGAKVIRRASGIDDARYNAIELAPAYERQEIEFGHALAAAWQQGGWAVYIDELFYLSRMGLEKPIERLLTQGRSKGITVITGMQRPVGATRFALSQATHLVSFRLEGRDITTVKEATNPAYAAAVASVDRFEACWYYKPTRAVWRGTVQDLGGEV